jgi:hypothetical protein
MLTGPPPKFHGTRDILVVTVVVRTVVAEGLSGIAVRNRVLIIDPRFGRTFS